MDLNSVITLRHNQSAKALAELISSEIMDKYERNFLYHITEENFPMSSEEGRREIFSIALKNATPDENEIKNLLHYKRRKALIEESAEKCLLENKSLSLGGFMTFRLGSYKNELKDICTNAGEEYAALREYDEFLDMLRFFVSVQSPREDVIHIKEENGAFTILNRLKRDITLLYSSDLPREDNFTEEDILLSTLISISPKKIIIHDKKENYRIYETIDEIFENVLFV